MKIAKLQLGDFTIIEPCAGSRAVMVNTQEKLSSWMAVDMGYLKIQVETFLSAFGFSWLVDFFDGGGGDTC